MAKYIERLEELRDAGKLTDEEFADLADLSAAKDAIKEFNQIKSERDDLASFKQNVETAPKRKEALKRAGIDYDALPKYGQKALDGIPAEDLDDLEKVSKFVKDEGFEASIKTPDPGEQSGADTITAALTDMGSGTPVRTDAQAEYEAARDAAKTPEELRAVLAKHGQLDEG